MMELKEWEAFIEAWTDQPYKRGYVPATQCPEWKNNPPVSGTLTVYLSHPSGNLQYTYYIEHMLEGIYAPDPEKMKASVEGWINENLLPIESEERLGWLFERSLFQPCVIAGGAFEDTDFLKKYSDFRNQYKTDPLILEIQHWGNL